MFQWGSSAILIVLPCPFLAPFQVCCNSGLAVRGILLEASVRLRLAPYANAALVAQVREATAESALSTHFANEANLTKCVDCPEGAQTDEDGRYSIDYCKCPLDQLIRPKTDSRSFSDAKCECQKKR